MKKIVLAVVILMVSVGVSIAHSGRTNSEGCHYNRTTGEYHCHG